MKHKSKTSSEPNLTKIFTKKSSVPTLLIKTKDQGNGKSVSANRSQKKSKHVDKQNIENNIPSPQSNKIKGKNFKPKIKKPLKLQLSNTVSLVINESCNNSSSNSAQKQDLLDSLLYGQIDLTYSHDFMAKQLQAQQQESDQLLIQSTDKDKGSIDLAKFKCYKNLSPIKSISQYSVTQNENNIFVIQKINIAQANAIIKIRNNQYLNNYKNQQTFDCILLRRLLALFNQKIQVLMKFYYAIHKAVQKKQLQSKLRQFLFQNSIIFNKNQLNQFTDHVITFCRKLSLKQNLDRSQQFSQQKFQTLIQQIFLNVNQGNSNIFQYLWLSQGVSQKLFYQKDLTSLWQLISQIFSQTFSHKDLSKSQNFSQSRFCTSSMMSSRLDCSQLRQSTLNLYQNQDKSRNQWIQKIGKWLKQFLRLPKTDNLQKEATKISFISSLH